MTDRVLKGCRHGGCGFATMTMMFLGAVDTEVVAFATMTMRVLNLGDSGPEAGIESDSVQCVSLHWFGIGLFIMY
jgi:hypothetical protein